MGARMCNFSTSFCLLAILIFTELSAQSNWNALVSSKSCVSAAGIQGSRRETKKERGGEAQVGWERDGGRDEEGSKKEGRERKACACSRLGLKGPYRTTFAERSL